MARYTPSMLADYIGELNTALAENDIPKRFEFSPRNNYQAVDEYSVDELGMRIGSGVDCNVGCGTSREVREYCHTRYLQLLTSHLRKQLESKGMDNVDII